MYDFVYIRPSSVADATALLGQHEDARPLAGGMSLLSAMKVRLAAPSHLVDLARLEGLSGISTLDGELVLGAMTRHCDVAASPLVCATIPALARLAGGIGDRQIRHRGTLGGSLANADPAACYPSAALALGAVLLTDRREIAADDFFLGPYETALAADEILIGVRFRRPVRAGYVKFPHPASRFALVGVFVADFGAQGIRVAVTGAAGAVFRAAEIERALIGDYSEAAALRVAVSARNLNADHAASAEYRSHLISVMAARAVAQSRADQVFPA